MLNAFRIVYSSVAGNHQVTRDALIQQPLRKINGLQAAIGRLL
jgi:hypothetical protein